jgi:hypothetical protein
MWKANAKTTKLVPFLDSLFPKVWKRLWTCRKTGYYFRAEHSVCRQLIGSLGLLFDSEDGGIALKRQ